MENNKNDTIKEPCYPREMEDVRDFRKMFDIQKAVATKIAGYLDIIFKAEKEIRQKHGGHFVDVDYSISHQEGSEIFFATFKVNKGLTKIERTFLFDIWHNIAGLEDHENYLRNEVRSFVNDILTRF